MTITGTSFTGATAVKFGTTAATTFTVNSSTSITATSPAGTGTVDVTVTTAGGTSPTSCGRPVHLRGAPTVTRSARPAARPPAGPSVTITGTSFTGATAVNFGPTAATSFTSSTRPPRSPPLARPAPGTVDVTVTTAGGTSPITSADQFTYVALRRSPRSARTSGPAAGGTTVTITGTNFTGATAVKLRLDRRHQLHGQLGHLDHRRLARPKRRHGRRHRHRPRSGTSATSAADQFTYAGCPTVTAHQPDQRAWPPAAPSVTITGTNFTGATAVTFGATAATSFTVNSATSITAIAPAGSRHRRRHRDHPGRHLGHLSRLTSSPMRRADGHRRQPDQRVR